MEWTDLTESAQIQNIQEVSKTTPCLIYKHSTQCSISQMAKMRLESVWDFSSEDVIPYYLDILNYRSLSSEVTEIFRTEHESPQVLLIRDGHCTYDASHFDISLDELKECFHDTF